MEFRDTLRRRRMVRNYLEEEIDEATIERILDAARRAPSAGFTQGQSFVVITDPIRRAAIAEASGERDYVERGLDPWLSRAPVHIVVCADENEYHDRYREPDKLKDGAEMEWPVPYWYVDAGASLMLILLAAVDEGLAAGFAGGHSFDDLKKVVGIPAGVHPIGVVTIGRPAPDRKSSSLQRGRRPVREVVFRDEWGKP